MEELQCTHEGCNKEARWFSGRMRLCQSHWNERGRFEMIQPMINFKKRKVIKIVDVTEAMEGQYLTAECVKSSPTKEAVVTDGGEYTKSDYGKKLCIEINIDRKKKIYRPNIDSAKNLAGVWGKESDLWVGKTLLLRFLSTIVDGNSEETILAIPKMGSGTPTTEETVTEEDDVVSTEDIIMGD